MKTLVNGVCLVFLKCESFLKFKRKKKNRKWKKKGGELGRRWELRLEERCYLIL